MDPKPSISKKRVRLTDPDYEEQLLKWYNEAISDCSDGEQSCEEDFAVTSDHETDSEIEGKQYYCSNSRF